MTASQHEKDVVTLDLAWELMRKQGIEIEHTGDYVCDGAPLAELLLEDDQRLTWRSTSTAEWLEWRVLCPEVFNPLALPSGAWVTERLMSRRERNRFNSLITKLSKA